MAYNTKEVLKDVDGNPISQYYDPITDSYKPVEGSGGGNKVVVENNQGLSLIPILDKLSQLTGTVIDEESRKSNEVDRKSKEVIRESNESTRKSNETTRVNQENTRKSQETSRQSSESNRETEEGKRVTAENTRKSQETARQTQEGTRNTNEGIRQSQESNRESNEDLRIALYDDLLSKVASGFFKGEKGDTGNGLEYTWNGTQLGVRVEGTTEYVYVDLKGEKGETGEIENLTGGMVTDALGYVPLSEDSLPSNLETTTGSQAKANVALTSANQYTDQKVGNVADDLLELEHSELSSIATDVDDEGIYRSVEYRRKDNTLYAKSTLIGSYPYSQIKIDYYNGTGNEIIKPISWNIGYDENDFPYIREVI